MRSQEKEKRRDEWTLYGRQQSKLSETVKYSQIKIHLLLICVLNDACVMYNASNAIPNQL